MMLEFPLWLHPCRLCHGNSEILDRRSFRSDATLFLDLVFPLTTVPQRLAKLLLLWGEMKKSSSEKVITGGLRSGAQPSKIRITPFRMSKGVMTLLSLFIFPWFQYL